MAKYNVTFTKEQVIEIGNKLANANIVVKYPPRSHSHNASTLFPQTNAQYEWLRKKCGTTYNNIIPYTKDEVISICPELEGHISASESELFCRINISL